MTAQVFERDDEVFSRDCLESLPYETPFFLFSKNRILGAFGEFKRYFPGAGIHYAMKANSEPAVLKTLADKDCGFEIASSYELRMLKKLAVPPEKIIYGTSVKPASHIEEFYRYGGRTFAVDSLPEMEKIAQLAPESRVFVRLSVDDAGSVFRFSEKFGTDRRCVIPFLRRACELGLQPYGISFHVGSQASNPQAWANALEIVREILEELAVAHDMKIEAINIGGGYPCDYASTKSNPCLQVIAENIYRQYRKLPYQPQLVLEPGRGIIASSGIAVVSIIGRIQRSNRTWLFLDAGVYNGFFEAMAYQGSTRYRVTSLRCFPKNTGDVRFAIAGPTGDSPDIITRGALLPAEVKAGDRLVIHDAGAYTLSCASRFNGFPKPKAYLV